MLAGVLSHARPLGAEDEGEEVEEVDEDIEEAGEAITAVSKFRQEPNTQTFQSLISKMTSPILGTRSGKRWVMSRPTMPLMMRSSEMSCFWQSSVSTVAPSRRMVIWSATLRARRLHRSALPRLRRLRAEQSHRQARLPVLHA